MVIRFSIFVRFIQSIFPNSSGFLHWSDHTIHQEPWSNPKGYGLNNQYQTKTGTLKCVNHMHTIPGIYASYTKWLTWYIMKMHLKTSSAKMGRWVNVCNMIFKLLISQGLKLTLIPRSDFLLLLSKSWSKSDRHRSYFLSLKADIWLDWVAKLCS